VDASAQALDAPFLNPSEAARQLGVSAKALRLYEQRGLIAPRRTAAGWRVYGPDEMARAAEIVALRALGLSLAQVARVLDGDRRILDLLSRCIRRHLRAASANFRQRSKRSSGYAPILAGARRRQPANWRA